MEKQFFSLPEAAAVLGISRIAVFKKVRKGSIEAIRIGRNWAIPVEALRAHSALTSTSAKKAGLVRPAGAEEKETLPPRADTEMSDMGWD